MISAKAPWPALEAIRSRVQLLGHLWDDREGHWNLVGIRAFGRASDLWQDHIWGISRRNGALISVESGAATTSPGKPGLLEPSNYKGTAILLPGQYPGMYRVGPTSLHGRTGKAPYRAFEQAVEAEYLRDNDRDEILDIGTTGYAESETHYRNLRTALTLDGRYQKANIKSNLHRASQVAGKLVPAVGPYSLGCQVIQDVGKFIAVLAEFTNAIPVQGNRVTYTLLDQWWDLPAAPRV